MRCSDSAVGRRTACTGPPDRPGTSGAFNGPASPPPGPAHRYVFTVYALDVETLDVPDEATSAACRFTLLAHAIDSASFTAHFGIDA